MWAEEWADYEDSEREFLTCLARDIIPVVLEDSIGAYADKITKKGVDLSAKYDALVRLILRCRYLYDEAISDKQFWEEIDELRKPEKPSRGGRPRKSDDPWAQYRSYYEEPSADELLHRERNRPADPLTDVYLAVRDWWVSETGQPFHLRYNLVADYDGYSPAGKLLFIISRDCQKDLDAAQKPPPSTEDMANKDAKPDPRIVRLRELHSHLQRKTRDLPPSDPR